MDMQLKLLAQQYETKRSAGSRERFEIRNHELMTLPSDQDATGRTLGHEEMKLVCAALRTGTLTSTKGQFTKQFETAFAELYQVKHAHACASGSAAVHIAVAAINPEPGDEIITTSITDMGALTPIVYQGAIPVFCDVDPVSGNVTAGAIAARISPRTKAIVVTHLFGNPCDMTAIMALAHEHNIPVIEDCAQAFLASDHGKYVGTIGHIGCFSLQQGKHVTTGEGGVVITNDDRLARHMFLYINKAWGYGDSNPDHYFLALNYRMTELQAAVAVAQLAKLRGVVERRRETAQTLTDILGDLDGITIAQPADQCEHSYWKFCLQVDPLRIQGGAVGLAKALKGRNIASAPRYIQKPAFRCQVFRDQVTFGKSRFPFNLATPEAVDYAAERFPGTFRYLDEVLVLPWNECYDASHIEYIADAIIESVNQLQVANS